MPAGFAAQIDAIAARSRDPATRAVAALRLVEDEIRYTSLSIGPGGYLPRTPPEIVASGYGDCKDKAVLLVAALHRLGIVAVPALTDIDNGPGLAGVLPSPLAFGHVIVRATIGGWAVWLDPTSDPQGGSLAYLAPIGYGYALPIVAGQRALERIPGAVPKAPVVESVETYRGVAGGPLTLNVVTRYRGGSADWMRNHLAGESRSKLAGDYLDYYRRYYPAIERTIVPQVGDDRVTGVLTVHEHYRLARLETALAKRFLVRAPSVEDIYAAPPDGPRRLPLAIGDLGERVHRIVLITPGFAPPLPAAQSVSGPGFRYTMTVARTGDVATIEHRLRGLARTIAPGDVPAYRDAVAKVGDNIGWYVDLTSTAGGIADDKVHLVLVLSAVLAGLVALIAGIVALVVAFGRQRRDGAAMRVHPVHPALVVGFGLISWGLYPTAWMWLCWRWARLFGGRTTIWPFWRWLFAVFWLWPLFASAAEQAEPAPPRCLGAVASVALLAVGIASAFVSWLRPEWAATMPLTVVLQTLCFLPAAVAVWRNPQQVRPAMHPAAWTAAIAAGASTLFALGAMWRSAAV